MSRTHKRPAPVQGEINPERFDPHSWGAEARRPLSALVGIDLVVAPEKPLRVANPEPQRVVVETVKVTAAVNPDAPAKTRRPGIAVPMMSASDREDISLARRARAARIDTPEGHVDAMANVHSWDL